MKFYTYLWLRGNGTPYYVGKGCGRRAYGHAKHEWIRVPKDPSRIIVQFFDSESDAFFAERFLIELYGRIDLKTGYLMNRSDGGDGLCNPSPETIRRLSESHKNPPEEIRKKYREAVRRPPPPGTYEKIAASNRASWLKDPNRRAKLRAGNGELGKKLWKDPGFRARMKSGIERRSKNPEYLAKLSLAMKLSWERRRTTSAAS